MPTSFDKVEELALVTVNDYKLVKLFNRSREGFEAWCDNFLLSAIPNFYECRQPLDYDLSARAFNSNLTNTEISILADLWVIEWMDREVQDPTQMDNKLQLNSNFTTHSPAQNLKERKTFLDGLREKVNQKITQYQLQDISNLDL